MASQSSVFLCQHLFLRNNNYRRYFSELKKLARGLHSSQICNGPEFQMPARITRSPTDILKALDSTVSRDKSGPHYRFHDDPFLIPTSPMEKRVFSLSKESGRKAAAWIRDNHPHLFTANTADEPVIKKFLPVEEYTEEHEVSEEILLQLIESCKVQDAATVYRLCTSKQIELSAATKQALLEFMCYHNEEEATSDDWVEELSYSQIQRPGKDFLNTWKSGGLAEEIFETLQQPSAAAYCALIRGLAKYNNVEDAWLKFQEAQAAGVALDVDTYNALLLTVPVRHEGSEERVQIIIGLLKNMASKGLRPNLYTLNNVLQVLSVSAHEKSKGFSLEVLSEMVRHGVKPSLATYFFLLTIHCRKSKESSGIIFSILDELEKHEGDLPLLDPRDTFFFMQAMDVCCSSAQNLDAARRLHALLETGKNERLLGENTKEMIYYRYYVLLSLKHLTFDDFMLVYNDLVPHVYAPETPVIEEILTAVGVQGAFQYLPTLWTDLSSLILTVDKLLTALVSAMTHYVPDATDVAYEDGSQPSRKTEQNETVIKAVPLSEQLSRIIGHIVSTTEEALELEQRRRWSWTVPLVSNMLSVLATCGGAQVGRRILQLVTSHPQLMVGEVPADDVHSLCKLALREEDYQTAMSCVSYVKRHDPSAVPAMASEIAAAEPRDKAIRAKLNALIITSSVQSKDEAKRPTAGASDTSSSSSSDESGMSSSDEEDDRRPPREISPSTLQDDK